MARRARRAPGTGSIYRRKSDGKWVAAVLEPAGFGRRRLYLYADSPAEIEEKLVDAMRRVKRGSLPTNTRLTVGRHLEDWLEAVRPTIRPSTWIGYEGHIRMHLAPLAHVGLIRLQPSDLRRLIARLLDEGLAPATVGNAMTILRMALRQAQADGLLDRNVGMLVASPRVPHQEVQPFTLEECRVFLDATKDHRLGAMFTLVLAVGLRQGEALGLRWTAVDLDAALIRVVASLRPTPRLFRTDRTRGTRLQLVEPKTSSGRRVVSLPAFVVAALREQKVRQLEEKLAAGARWKGNQLGLVFTTPIGTPLDPRNVTHEYKAILEAAGLPERRFHDLRHSAATLMLASGFDLRTISEVLGHRTAGMSALYAHVLPSMKADVAAVIDQVLTHREAK